MLGSSYLSDKKTLILMVRLTVYLRKPEIPVGKSYGSRLSAWEALENMGCVLR